MPLNNAMAFLKLAMWIALIAAMSMIGLAAKWSIDNIGLWIVVPTLALIFWTASQIDKSDARKAMGQPPHRSPPPENPGQ